MSKARGARNGARAAAGRVEVSPLEAHLGYWLRSVSNHVSQAFQLKVERRGVTVAEWVVLRTLYDANGIQPSELASHVGLSRGAVSKLIERLSGKQLVAVSTNLDDRRAQVVSLRPKGRRLVPILAALADDNDTEAFGHLSADQRRSLLELLRTTVDRLGLSEPPLQ